MKKQTKYQKIAICLGISTTLAVSALIYPRLSLPLKQSDSFVSTSTLSQLESGGSTFDITTWQNPFEDVTEADWYYNSVGFVSHTGLMEETSENLFSPDLSVSRGLFIATLYHFAGNPEVSGSNPFKDVDSDILENAVIWASESALLPDIYGKKLYPDEEITREEVATIFYQLQLYQGGTKFSGSIPQGFTDISKLSYWAFEGIGWCLKETLIHGKNDNVLDPKSPLSRAELALMIEKYHNSISPSKAEPPEVVATVSTKTITEISEIAEEKQEESAEVVVIQEVSADLDEKQDEKESVAKEEEEEEAKTEENTEKLSTSSTTSTNSPDEITATITGSSSVRIYDRPSSSASIFTSFDKGLEVAVRGVSNGGKWYQVADGGTIGYVTKDYLEIDSEDVEKLAKLHNSYVAYIPEEILVSIYEAPSKSSSRLLTLRDGSLVTIIHTLEGWYQTDLGYVEQKYVQQISTQEYRSLNAELPVIEVEDPPTSKELGAEIATYAQKFLGYPYKTDGTTINGFNCIGFSKYIYGQFGISLEHSATAQYKMGVSVKKSNLQAGDLLFFGNLSHVGIYIGNNKLIHASSSSGKVIISDMGTAYYANNYYGARRLV